MPSKEIQLFILPYAGGSIASFKKLTDLLDPRVEVITVEYAGRGTRLKDALATSFDEMFEDAVNYCTSRRNQDIPYAVLGYSMGSVISYEMLSREKLGENLRHFFVSAEIPPRERRYELDSVTDPTDEWLIERAKELGGLDERMLGNKRFMDLYVRPMISDFRHLFEYSYKENDKIINCDATFFYCETDTPKDIMRKWEDCISGDYEYHEFGDNHFFINSHYGEMAQVINRRLFEKVV